MNARRHSRLRRIQRLRRYDRLIERAQRQIRQIAVDWMQMRENLSGVSGLMVGVDPGGQDMTAITMMRMTEGLNGVQAHVIHVDTFYQCRHCNGSGEIYVPGVHFVFKVQCSKCKGSGREINRQTGPQAQ